MATKKHKLNENARKKFSTLSSRQSKTEADARLGWSKPMSVVINDRFRKGNEAAIRHTLADRFEEFPSVGANLFFRRREGRTGQHLQHPAPIVYPNAPPGSRQAAHT
jgi:hypothetical protein